MDAEPTQSLPPPEEDMPIDYGEGEGEEGVEDEPFVDLVTDSGAEADAEMDDRDDPATSPAAGLAEAVMGELVPSGDGEVPMLDAREGSTAVSAYAALPASVAVASSSLSPTIPLPAHPGFSSPPLVQTSNDGLQTSALGHSAATGAPASYFSFPAVTPTPDSVLPPPAVSSPLPLVPSPNPAPAGIVEPHSSPVIAVQPPPELIADEAGFADDEASRAPTPQSAPAPQAQSHEDLVRINALATQEQHSRDRTQSQEQVVENHGEHETRVVQRQKQGSAEPGEGASQENDVTIRQEMDDESGKERVDVDMSQTNKGEGPPVKQVNNVKVVRRGDDCASGTHSGGSMARPDIRKPLLSVVDLEDPLGRELETPDEGEEPQDHTTPLVAPTVLLSINNSTYSLFKRHVSAPDEDVEPKIDIDPSLPVLFPDPKDHRLYYEQLETFIEALHSTLPELATKQDELILSFEAIGIALPEDNIYTREVSLYDFDRIHVGCGLPGRLQVTLGSQARFSTGFNALAQHIANSYAGVEQNGGEAGDEEGLPTTLEGEGESLALNGADPGGEGAGEEEAREAGPEAEFEDGQWAGDGQPQDDALGEGEGEEERYDELDDEDFAALVEGAQEDLLLSEEYGEVEDEQAGLEGEEGDFGEQVEEGNFGGEGEDPDSAFVDPEDGFADEAENAADSSALAPGDDDAPLDSRSPALVATRDLDSSVPSIIQIGANGMVGAASADDDLDEGENDVVIDYEEVFGPASTLPSPALRPQVDTSAPLAVDALDDPTSPSPKRTRDDFGLEGTVEENPVQGEALVTNGAPKRAKIDALEPSPPGTA